MDKLTGKSDEVESYEAVAKRLSRAMHVTYEPVQEKAKRTDLEAVERLKWHRLPESLGMKKRLEGALEAEKRRNDRQQSRYKVLDDLAQANPDAVKSLLSQARAQVDLAKIRERVRPASHRSAQAGQRGHRGSSDVRHARCFGSDFVGRNG